MKFPFKPLRPSPAKPGRWLARLLLLCYLAAALFPIYWMLITSLKPEAETYRVTPTFFPESFTAGAYGKLFTKTKFMQSVFNSVFVSSVVSAATILLSFPCSYALSRIVFRGRNLLSQGILITYLIPAAVLFIPFYSLLAQMNLTNNLWGLILVYPTKTIPYAVWIMMPFIASIPRDLEEAAVVDGCTRAGSLSRIVLPLCLPSLAATFIFSFTMCWGEYLYALVIMTQEKHQTIPLFISGLSWADMTPWPQVMAAGILVSIPIVIIYTFASEFLAGGMTDGGVKM